MTRGDKLRGQGDMEARDACAAREGTSGQGDMGTRGEAKIHGRHAVPPLPATESSSYRFAGCGIILI